jgi:hypothetical protein
MKALALTTLALLGLATNGLRHNKLAQTFLEAELPNDVAKHTCSQAITRVNSQANFDYNATIKAGTKWVDPQFGNSDAIYWNDFNQAQVSGYISNINWARANTRFTNPTLFGNAITTNNIHQGALGDCYYLCSISALAEWPARLKNVFLTQTYNSAGIFAVKVYIRGKPTTIVIDDFLPFYGTTGTNLLFDKISSGEGLWAPLLEKVWAKASGNYDVTSGGWMSEAIDFLTGAPSISWTNTDTNTIKSVGLNAWNIISASDTAQNIMTAAVAGDNCVNGVNGYSLPCGHAYTMIGTYTVKDAAGVAHRLMLIRNPWGVDAGYSGAWNDGDTKRWTAAAKAQVPAFVNNVNDGAFFVEDVDFVKAFQSFTISYFRETWNNNILDITGDTAGAQRKFTFTTAKAQEVFVGMEFYNARMYAHGCKQSTTGIMYLFKGTTQLGGTYTYDWNNFNSFHFDSLAAGTYTL